MRQFIFNGMHKLSGVSMIKVEDEYYESAEDGILLTIDGVNYIAVTDPDDGYRSYGYLYPASENMIQKNTFPEQDVLVDNHIERSTDEEGYEQDYEETVIYNVDGGLILRVGTDYSDTYYPCAIFRYNPENLPINQKILHDERMGEYVVGLLNRAGDSLDDAVKFMSEEPTPDWMTLLDAFHAVREVLSHKGQSLLS